MAEKRRQRGSRDGSDEDRSEGSNGESSAARGSRTEGRLDAGEMAARAKHQIADLTGKRLEAVSGMARADDGWRVTVEVVELERIPPSTDVLGSYEVELDGDGNLVGYERTRRYVRSQADEF